jgi:CRP/FNR family transcriptional regulator, cyclic AMP receptor protein
MGSMFRLEYTRLPIFAGLDSDQISQLESFFYECTLEKDRIIFEQNQPADYLYILLNGEVAVRYKPYDGPLLTVARIEPGGVFGWSAALGREVYTSGAVALKESIAYRLRGESLPEICARYPETGKIWLERLASVIAERLRSTHAQVLDILSKGKDATNSRD